MPRGGSTIAGSVKISQALICNPSSQPQVLLCIPHPYMYTLAEEFKGSNVGVGAQSVYFEEKGAFTGAVSTSMVASIGCTTVLAGHRYPAPSSPHLQAAAAWQVGTKDPKPLILLLLPLPAMKTWAVAAIRSPHPPSL